MECGRTSYYVVRTTATPGEATFSLVDAVLGAALGRPEQVQGWSSNGKDMLRYFVYSISWLISAYSRL